MNFDSTKEPSISVIESALNSRIDQMIALTLPSDRHRLEILKTIKTTYSVSQRLSSFCDYMIDYVQTLSSKLDKAKSELHEFKHHSGKTHKSSKHSKHVSKSEKHTKRFPEPNYEFNEIHFDEISDDNNQNDFLDVISNVECLKSSLPPTNVNKEPTNVNQEPVKKDDYESTLKLLNVQEGQLSVSVNDLIQQNLRLQRLHNQDRAILLKQHAVILGFDDPPNNINDFGPKNDRPVNESDTDSDFKKRPSSSDNDDGIIEECKRLKNDFQHISNEIQNLNSQVRKRNHYSRKRCKYA